MIWLQRDFLKGRMQAIAAVLALVGIGAATFILLPPPAVAIVDENYMIDYGGLKAYKSVYITNDIHRETITLSADAQNLGFVIYTVIPQELGESAADVSTRTNALVEAAGENILLTRPKNVPNEISVEMEFRNAGRNICTVNAPMPAEYIDSLGAEDRQLIEAELLALGTDITCDEANELENRLAANLYGMFSGETMAGE